LDAIDVSRVLADALEAAGVPYAVGGALSYGYWADPRGTHDVDLNLFVPPEDADGALDPLISAGLQIDRAGALRTARERGDARGTFQGMRVDLFFNSIPLHDSAAARVRRVPLANGEAWILSAEDLVVLKLMFYRGKDLLDVEKIVAMQRDAFDRGYVRAWLVGMLGEEDHRVTWWDALCRQVPA
jgi:hypothetical protein